MIRKSTTERVKGSDGSLEAIYWYHRDGDEKVKHGPLVSYYPRGERVESVGAFANGTPTAGAYHFNYDGLLRYAEVAPAPDRSVLFSYSPEGEEPGQLVQVAGEPCCCTRAGYSLRQDAVATGIREFGCGISVDRVRTQVEDWRGVWRRRPDLNRRMRVLQAGQSDAQSPTDAATSDVVGPGLPPGLPEQDGPRRTPTDTADLPADLSRLASIWPTLPDHIRAAIMTLAEEHGGAAEPHDSAGRLAWLMLPEKTRASIVESIGNAMRSLLESEEREITALEESLEQEPRPINERERAADE